MTLIQTCFLDVNLSSPIHNTFNLPSYIFLGMLSQPFLGIEVCNQMPFSSKTVLWKAKVEHDEVF